LFERVERENLRMFPRLKSRSRGDIVELSRNVSGTVEHSTCGFSAGLRKPFR